MTTQDLTTPHKVVVFKYKLFYTDAPQSNERYDEIIVLHPNENGYIYAICDRIKTLFELSKPKNSTSECLYSIIDINF